VLSVVLGVLLAAVFLILKPIAAVKELPKQTVAGEVYYIEGSRDSAKARQAALKQKVFLQGRSVTVNEDELNTLLASGTAPAAPKPAAKPGDKAKPAAEPPAEKALTEGSPNFRIRDGVLQIGLPLRVSLLGFDQKVILIARGNAFTKTGDAFVFEPGEFYVGSCPLQRLPALQGILVKRLLAATSVPEPLAAAWGRVSNVAVDGATLKLTVQ